MQEAPKWPEVGLVFEVPIHDVHVGQAVRPKLTVDIHQSLRLNDGAPEQIKFRHAGFDRDRDRKAMSGSLAQERFALTQMAAERNDEKSDVCVVC